MVNPGVMPILKPQFNGNISKNAKRRQPTKTQLKEYYNQVF